MSQKPGILNMSEYLLLFRTNLPILLVPLDCLLFILIHLLSKAQTHTYVGKCMWTGKAVSVTGDLIPPQLRLPFLPLLADFFLIFLLPSFLLASFCVYHFPAFSHLVFLNQKLLLSKLYWQKFFLKVLINTSSYTQPLISHALLGRQNPILSIQTLSL